jgi:hypothetical protein
MGVPSIHPSIHHKQERVPVEWGRVTVVLLIAPDQMELIVERKKAPSCSPRHSTFSSITTITTRHSKRTYRLSGDDCPGDKADRVQYTQDQTVLYVHKHAGDKGQDVVSQFSLRLLAFSLNFTFTLASPALEPNTRYCVEPIPGFPKSKSHGLRET